MLLLKKDEELIEIILENEQEADKAFEVIYNRYNNKIYKFIRNSVSNVDDCMDLFQQVFLSVYDGLNKFNRKYKFSTWIFRIAINAISNFRRGQARKIKLVKKYKTFKNFVYQPDYSNMVYHNELMKALNQAINNLSEKYRYPLSLIAAAGLSNKEISNILKIPDRTIRYRVKKAKEILKRQLKNIIKVDIDL